MLNYSLKDIDSKLFNVFITSIELSEGHENDKGTDPHGLFYGFKDQASSLTSKRSKPMNVDIYMCIKHQNPLFLAQNKEISKMKIAVVQVTSLDTKSKIDQKPFSYLPVSRHDKLQPSMQVKFYSLLDLLPKSLTYDRVGGSFGQRNPFALSDYRKIPFFNETNVDGAKVYNIPIKSNFTIRSDQGGQSVNNLCYYAYVFIDHESLSENNSFSFFAKNRRKLTDVRSYFGPITAENVIENNLTVKKSYVFKTQSGKIWAGDAHQMDNGSWMSGATHNNSSEPLNRITINNSKIKDNRIFEKLSRVKFLSGYQNSFISPLQKIKSEKVKDGMQNAFVKKPQSISEIYLSRDKSGNCRFFFSIDIEKILKQNSNYPQIIENIKQTDLKQYHSLLRRTKIQELVITRKRVLSKENATTSVSYLKYPVTEEEQIVVKSKDSNTRNKLEDNIFSTNTEFGGVGNVSPTKIGSILEIQPLSPTRNIGIRHFTGTDYGVSRQKDVMYEYSIKVSITDPLTSHIQNIIDQIDNMIDSNSTSLNFNMYYKDATSENGNFDSYLNRFDESFITSFNRKYVISDNNYIFSSIRDFVQMIYSVSNYTNTGNVPMVDAVNYLITISSPNTGSPEGILKVIQLMKRVKNSLLTVLNSSKSYTKSRESNTEATSKNSNLGQGRRSRVFVVEKSFNNLYETMSLQDTGFDYLFMKSDSNSQNSEGLTLVSKNTMTKRFDLEVEKYFNTSKPIIEIKNSRGDVLNRGDNIEFSKYSFLSPSNIFLKTNDRETTFEALSSAYVSSNRKEMNELVSDIIIYNKTKNLNYSKSSNLNDKDETTSSMLQDILQGQGVTIEIPNETRKQKERKVKIFNNQSLSERIDKEENLFVENQQIEAQKAISSKDLLNSILQITETDFLQENNSIKNYLFNDDDSATKLKKQLSNSILRNRVLNTNRSPNNRSFNYAPIHTKALILSVNNSSEVKQNKAFNEIKSQGQDYFRNPENYGFLWLNYRSIKMIEVLIGFDDSKTDSRINCPIWTRLDKIHLESTKNNTLICRLVDYEDDHSGIKKNKSLELPVFNEIFAINLAENKNSSRAITTTFVDFNNREFESVYKENKFSDDAKEVLDYINNRIQNLDTNAGLINLLRTDFLKTNMVNYKNGKRTNYQSRAEIKIKYSKNQYQLNKNMDLNKIKDMIKSRGLQSYLPKGVMNSSSNSGVTRGRTGGTRGTSGTSGGGSTY